MPALEAMDKEYDIHLQDLAVKIQATLGAINPASPTQLIKAIKETLPSVDLVKEDFNRVMNNVLDEDEDYVELSTSRAILEREAHKHPVIADILEYRKWHKLHGTYIRAVLDKHATAHGGSVFVHPSFNQNRVETNRLSCSNPNLHQIPRKPKEEDPQSLNVKKQFISRFGGGSILEADFSQAELRVAAMLSGDTRMIAALTSGRDVHTETASMLLGKPYRLITDSERQRCKTLNFLILYGGGANTLAKQLGIYKDEAKDLINQYFMTFPELKGYISRVHRLVKRDLVVESPFGFRRHFQPPPNGNWNQWQGWAVQRMAFNHIIQNTAACITYVALIELDKRIKRAGLKSVMFGTVHDSVLFDVAPGEEKIVAVLAREVMEDPPTKDWGVELTVPMVCDVEIGPNWGEKKEFVEG